MAPGASAGERELVEATEMQQETGRALTDHRRKQPRDSRQPPMLPTNEQARSRPRRQPKSWGRHEHDAADPRLGAQLHCARSERPAVLDLTARFTKTGSLDERMRGPAQTETVGPAPRCPSDNKRRAWAWRCRGQPLHACGGAEVATGSLVEQDRQRSTAGRRGFACRAGCGLRVPGSGRYGRALVARACSRERAS